MRNPKFRFWFILTSLTLGLIFVQSALPASTSNAESGGLLKVLQEFWPSLTHSTLRSIAHFAEYFILGICSLGMFFRTKHFALSKPWLFCLFTALCDETLQGHIEGRSAQVADIRLDFMGAIVGVLIMWAILKIRKK